MNSNFNNFFFFLYLNGYKKIYVIRIIHGHFNNEPCTAFQCRLTSEGKELARRRGIILKQTAPSEWTFYYRNSPDTNEDILTMDLYITDGKFLTYTCWSDFNPSTDYIFELPSFTQMISADSAFFDTRRKRRIGSGNCIMSLRLNDAVVSAAEEGNPVRAVLHFKAL